MEHLTHTLKRTCKNCKQTYMARRTSQKFCSTECGIEYRAKRRKELEIKRKIKNKKQSEERIKARNLFWSNPDIIAGYKAISDYLNIGEEEIRRRWVDLPIKHQEEVSVVNGKIHASHKKICVLKQDLDAWIEEKGYWKLKETTVKNYKEPLKKIPEGGGYGYLGAITVTKDGEGVQCHICGKFFLHLSGHIWQTHKIATSAYKEQFQLAYSTPLSADNHRENLKLLELERIKNMTPEEKEAYRNRRKSGYAERKHVYKLTLETKNKRGTCPDQLIDQLQQCYKKIGHTPSKTEFIAWCGSQRLIHKIYDTFGSYTKAVEIANLAPVPPHVISQEDREKISDEELLEYLRIFYEQNQKSPTATDWYSHDLPSYGRYIRRFGSIKKARELAEIPDPIVDRKGKKYFQLPEKTL